MKPFIKISSNYMSKLTSQKEKIIEEYYKNPRYGLSSANKLYEVLKAKNLTWNIDNISKGITLNNIKEWLSKQEIHQILKSRHSKYNSFVAENPLDQFQIDLIFMEKQWHNSGYKYLLSCVDVFSKKGLMIPMKTKTKKETAEAINLLFQKMGKPKSIYSDKGSEFNNSDVLDILKQHKIKIIFALNHAPFIESFNKTMKNKLYKYMNYLDTDNWTDAIDDILESYNNTPHSATNISPNKINTSNILQARMNIMKRAKIKNYPDLDIGDTVRIPVINKVAKGYKQQWTFETHKIENNNHDGTYTVNGEYYPRKELQLVKEIVKLPPKPVKERIAREEANKQGKAENSKGVKAIKDSSSWVNPTVLLEGKRKFKPTEKNTLKLR
jgi:hypothetical protein